MMSNINTNAIGIHLPDRNDCATDHDNCDQHCHNTHGLFYCTCDSGWRLDPDGHTCNGYNVALRNIDRVYHFFILCTQILMNVRSTVQAAHRSVTTLLVATTAPVMWASVLMLTTIPVLVSHS